MPQEGIGYNASHRMDLFGLSHIQERFERDLSSGRVKHAYLFVGPEHLGKMTLVTWMAQKLQCPSNGCGNCQICLQILNGSHADTFLYADDGESLPVETVREIILQANRTFTSRYLILAIENIDRLSRSGLNALLKTLEEPFDNVVFLLTARHTRFIPTTVLSRVSTHAVQGGTPGELAAYLTQRYPDQTAEALERLQHVALRRVGDCITLLSDPDEYARRATVMRSLANLLDAKRSDRLLSLCTLSEDKEGRAASHEALEIMSYLERERLISGITPPAKSVEHLELFQRSAGQLGRNVDPRLVLSNVALHY